MAKFKLSQQGEERGNVRPTKRVRIAEPTVSDSQNKAQTAKKMGADEQHKTFGGVPEIQAALGANGGKPCAGLVDGAVTSRF
jgi:hypothetical protein